MIGACKSCRHWEPLTDVHPYFRQRFGVPQHDADKYGRCGAQKPGEGALFFAGHAHQGAGLGALVTRRDYGCVAYAGQGEAAGALG